MSGESRFQPWPAENPINWSVGPLRFVERKVQFVERGVRDPMVTVKRKLRILQVYAWRPYTDDYLKQREADDRRVGEHMWMDVPLGVEEEAMPGDVDLEEE